MRSKLGSRQTATDYRSTTDYRLRTTNYEQRTTNYEPLQVLFFISDGDLFDARLVYCEVTRLFTQCNLPDELDENNQLTKEFQVLEEWEENDEDENEICYNEFCKVSNAAEKVIRAHG